MKLTSFSAISIARRPVVICLVGLATACSQSPSGPESALGESGGANGQGDGGSPGDGDSGESGSGGAGPGMSGGENSGGSATSAGGGESGGASASTGGADSGGAESGGASSGGAADSGGAPANGGGAGGAPLGVGGSSLSLPPEILLFTRTAGFRHDSIPDGVALLNSMAVEEGWNLTHTEDATVFNDVELETVSCVVFLSTTGDILDESQQAAFESWFSGGRAFVGVHAATDTEYDWPFYAELSGAQFKSHPAIQEATLTVENASHPATSHLGATWTRTDEWYDFLQNPRPNVQVLLTLDEGTYDGGTMGDDHPIAWFQELAGGRSFYTGLGHTSESYSEVEYIEHLRGGMRWALDLAD